MIVVEFSRFNCKGYWSLPHSLCQSTFLNPLTVSNTSLCLDNHRLLPSDPAPSGTPIACPNSYTLCISCLKLTSNGQKVCIECPVGYYVPPTGKGCTLCPTGCMECLYKPKVPIPEVHCDPCYPGFIRSKVEPHLCLCEFANQYPDPVTISCITCPPTCTACTSATSCTSCLAGYILSAGACTNCMPVCKTCTTGTACTSCKNNLVMSGTTCVCSGGKFLNPVTLTCITCATFDSNCLSCGYNPSYSASAPNPIKCLTPALGYYVLGSGATAACGANCDICTSNTVCTTCSNTYTLSGNICVCAPLYLTNSAPYYC